MATPTKRSFRLTRADGAALLVDVTSAGGRRPVVVICQEPEGLAARLARAGFAAVAFAPAVPEDLATVLDALGRGTLGVTTERCALLAHGAAAKVPALYAGTDPRVRALVTVAEPGSNADERVPVPWLRLSGAAADSELATTVQWLARQLA